MLRVALAFLLGNSSLAWLSHWPSSWAISAVLVSILAISMTLWRHISLLKPLRVLLILILGALLGHLWVVSWALVKRCHDLPDVFTGKPVTIEGHVVGVPTLTERYAQFDFKPDGWPHSAKITLTWFWQNKKTRQYHTPPNLIPGDWYRLTVRLKKPYGFYNPGSFDVEKQAFIQGIVGEGSVIQHQAYLVERQCNDWSVLLDRMRLKFNIQIQQLTEGSPYTGILQALTVGIRDKMSRAQWDLFQKTGTAHLMAISGLHVGLIAGLCFFVFSFFMVTAYATALVCTVFLPL
jgi:competence protein ComEC